MSLSSEANHAGEIIRGRRTRTVGRGTDADGGRLSEDRSASVAKVREGDNAIKGDNGHDILHDSLLAI